MQLGQIVLRLRQNTTSFGNLIGGAAELALATDNTLTNEMAFVIPLADNATDNKLDVGINQLINEKFGVVVALRNDSTIKDKLGIIAYDRLDTIRAEIWKAILGWLMTGAENPIYYSGGRLLKINRGYLWYQFEFYSQTRIDDDDGIEQEDLPYFDTLYADWVLSPDVEIPINEYLPVSSFDPDMQSNLDLTEDLDSGEFGRGFNIIFDKYTG